MRILLVADDVDDRLAVEAALTADGHDVSSCNDEFGGPCTGLDHVEACPLEQHVDLAVVARAANTRRGLGEMGSLCATRHRVGVIEMDPSQPTDESVAGLHAQAERGICHAYERAIIEALRTSGDSEGVFVTVSRNQGQVRVLVSADTVRSARMSSSDVAALADRVRDATRRHDRFARSIDVSVVRSA